MIAQSLKVMACKKPAVYAVPAGNDGTEPEAYG
jgi:hypothetical protein